MKKQILIIAIFTMALFAVNSKSYGQVVYPNYVETTGTPACTPAVPLGCASSAGALAPLPGVSYPYTITVAPVAATPGYIHWFVTDVNTVIDGTGTAPILQTVIDPGDGNGDYILTTDAIYDDNANTTATINITWKTFNGTTNEVLLVAYVYDNNGCTNNVEVFRIEPTFGFTLDIAGLLDNGTLGATECVSPVESAVYNDPNLTMNYGENWIFFTVNAANFDHSWMPNISVGAYTGAGTPGTVEWAYPDQAIINTAGVSSGIWNSATTPVLAQDASGSVGATGECIILRVPIVHGNNQHLADATLTMNIDGIMYDVAATTGAEYTNAIYADVDDDAAGTTCVQNVTDNATYDITLRPTLNAVTPTPFVTKN